MLALKCEMFRQSGKTRLLFVAESEVKKMGNEDLKKVVQSDNLTDEERKQEGMKRKLANLIPFKSDDELTEEEIAKQRELRAKGGRARGEQLKKAKTLKEVTLMLLSTRISREDAEKVLGESAKLIADEDLNVETMLTLKAIGEVAENGNIRALEYLRDTSGQQPKQLIDAQVDTISDAERRLINNLSNRLCILPNDKEA